MFCPKCGNEVQEGSKFCSFCGAQISTDSSEESKFIYELNGVKFDAFKVAWDTKLFFKRSFIHTADTTKALKKLTGAGSWDATKMERKMQEDKDLKKAILEKDAQEKAAALKEAIAEADLRDSAGVRCPICFSKNVRIREKGFSVGKAAAGVVLTGGVGLIAGLHGRKKLFAHCLNCGHEWKI